jgi:hypothetical protein
MSGDTGQLNLDELFKAIHALKAQREARAKRADCGPKCIPEMLAKYGIPFAFGEDNTILLSSENMKRAREVGAITEDKS